uniref:Helicase n=1 Tax=Panagrellus redivivus TaxID=6233 RepID=A0A7E4ZZ49_PANRE
MNTAAGKRISEKLKKNDLSLRPHQIIGIDTFFKWFKDGHGGILADEMGLGKTCQTIVALSILAQQNPKFRFIVLSPLSVMKHWEAEIKRFCCGYLRPFVYYGSKDERFEMRKEFHKGDWNICVTPYHIYRDDYSTLVQKKFDVFVVDEAQAIKTMTSQLFSAVFGAKASIYYLLTGTPVQNNIHELYSLLSLIDSKKYPCSHDAREEYCSQPQEVLETAILSAVKMYLLRRMKTEVACEIPEFQEVVIFHGLTHFQKEFYNSILVNNRTFLEENVPENHAKQNLLNTLMQLRKIINHPYLFSGVEPTPYVEGEHIINASGKFMVLMRMLTFLHANGHRCLIFSPYSRHLDILSDALTLKGFKHVHFDGSRKHDERQDAVESFEAKDSDVFCFLITTKAGGLGLTLVGADTVILLDNDFNPQNDLQAMARCHRIGQDKPVKVIRLLAEHTIDTAIWKRTRMKLKLSEFVLNQGGPSINANELRQVLLADLAKLNQVPESTPEHAALLSDAFFVEQLGDSKNNLWLNAPMLKSSAVSTLTEEAEEPVNFFPNGIPLAQRAIERNNDEAMLRKLTEELEKSSRKTRASVIARTKISAAERQRAIAAQEAAKAEKQAKREQLLKDREELKARLWASNNYQSKNIETIISGTTKQSPHRGGSRIFRVFGSVTEPIRDQTDSAPEAWIVQCVETSGRWGNGGVYAAIDALSPKPKEYYQFAARMNDLEAGQVHFVEDIFEQRQVDPSFLEPDLFVDGVTMEAAPEKLKRKVSVVFIVCKNNYTKFVMHQKDLKKCLSRIAQFGATRDKFPSIHMPMLWWCFNELTESDFCSIVYRELCARGFDAYIYHYRKRLYNTNNPVSSRAQPTQLFNLALENRAAATTYVDTFDDDIFLVHPRKRRPADEAEASSSGNSSLEASTKPTPGKKLRLAIDLSPSQQENRFLNDDDSQPSSSSSTP